AAGNFTKQINNNGAIDEAIATDEDFKSVDPFVPKQNIQHTKLVTDNSFNIGSQRLTLNVGYQRNQRMEFGNVLNPGEKNLSFDLRTVNYNVQYHLNEQNGLKTSFGVNGMQQTSKNAGVEMLIPEYDLFDIGAFIFSQKRFEKLTLSVGARFDNRTLNFNKNKKDFSNFSGSAGVSYEASSTVTLKFNLARGFRAPGIPELASNGAHEGTNRFEYGQLNLKSERSIQADAGIELNSEHISFTGSLFLNSIKDFVFYRKLESANGGDSIISDQGNDFFAFEFDQSNAKLYGGELIFDIHPHPLDWLHIENSFSFVRGILSEEQDGSKNLPFIPAARLVNEVKGDFFKKGKAFRNLYVRVELDNTFTQNHPFSGFNTETKTQGYSLLNAGMGADIMHKDKMLFNFSLSANNITDVAYQNHLSRLKYAPINPVNGKVGVFNMGRTFSLKINVPFNLKKVPA
ncbi:MAG TPA: TonB-dependent receptor, partial [Chitinophagaceae bacterium]|nr:TonB-dependent receptor [Chitinophagaceae bacterium]